MMNEAVITSFSAAVVFSIGALIFKINSDRNGDENLFMFGLFGAGIIGFLGAGLFSEGGGFVGAYLIAGIVIGVGSAFGNVYFMRALSFAPIGVVAPIINLNIAIIVIGSMIFYGEKLSGIEIIGIITIVVGLSLFQVKLKGDDHPKKVGWLPMLVAALIFMTVRNGGLKVTQEVGLDNTFVLLYAHCFAFGIFTVKLLRSSSLSERRHATIFLGFPALLKKNSFRMGVFGGFFSFLGLLLYSEALNKGAASVVVPIFSSYTIMLYFWARIITDERLERRQVISFGLCVLGTMLIGFSYDDVAR